MWNSHIRVHMLAFPGLGKAYRTDHKVLKDIAYALCSTYAKNMRLSGILYLHRITSSTFNSTYWRSLDVLKALCGPQSFQAITFVAISWEQIDEPTSSTRENELKNTTEFFRGNLVPNGSYTEMSFANRDSAIAIIEPIIKRQKTFVLDLQKQFVDEGLDLGETVMGLLVAQSARILAAMDD